MIWVLLWNRSGLQRRIAWVVLKGSFVRHLRRIGLLLFQKPHVTIIYRFFHISLKKEFVLFTPAHVFRRKSLWNQSNLRYLKICPHRAFGLVSERLNPEKINAA